MLFSASPALQNKRMLQTGSRICLYVLQSNLKLFQVDSNKCRIILAEGCLNTKRQERDTVQRIAALAAGLDIDKESQN